MSEQQTETIYERIRREAREREHPERFTAAKGLLPVKLEAA
jgi:hypothetical protein